MNARYLIFFTEIVDHGLNISAAAKAVDMSQPGMSKHLMLCEKQLGFDLLVRNGKHIADVTERGKVIYAATKEIKKILHQIETYAESGVIDVVDEKQAIRDELMREVRSNIAEALDKADGKGE